MNPETFERLSLKGRIAVVTGGTQGLGEAIAGLFADRGAAGLVIAGRNRENGARVKATLEAKGAKCVYAAADLAKLADVRAVTAAAEAAFGRIDVLVNAAAISDRGTIWDTSPELFERMFAINVRAPFFLMQEAAKMMRRNKTGGSIVNILSMSAHGGQSFITAVQRLEGRAADAHPERRLLGDAPPHPRQRALRRLDGHAGRGSDHAHLPWCCRRLAREGGSDASVRAAGEDERSRARGGLSRERGIGADDRRDHRFRPVGAGGLRIRPASAADRVAPVRRLLSEIVLIPWAGVLIGLVVVAAAVSAMSPYFLTVGNILGNVALYFSWFAIAGFGEALVMIGGGLDLSVGSAMGFSGMIAALALAAGMPLWIGLTAGLAAGALVGFVNGLAVTRLHLNPFIATLATLGIFRGITYGIVEGQAITPPSNGAGAAFTALGTGALARVPSPVIVMLALALVCFVALNHTKFGRHVYALGGNEAATRLLGLDVRRLKMTLYVISGLAAAVGGILLTARAGTALPDAAEGYELQVIAGVIIGGVSLSGGQGTIPGVLIGAALLGVISNGIVLAGLAGYWQQLITGLVIAAAAALDVLRQRLSYLRAA